MSTATSVYAYSSQQARVVHLYDAYRSSLMNAKYYGARLRLLKRTSVGFDILIALGTSSAFAGLAIWKGHIGGNLWSGLLALSVLLAALRPILKLTDQLDRYAKLQYGYLEVFYRFQSLTADIRGAGGMSTTIEAKARDLDDRFRALELEGDAYQSPNKLLKAQDEVERSIPADSLWLPEES